MKSLWIFFQVQQYQRLRQTVLKYTQDQFVVCYSLRYLHAMIDAFIFNNNNNNNNDKNKASKTSKGVFAENLYFEFDQTVFDSDTFTFRRLCQNPNGNGD